MTHHFLHWKIPDLGVHQASFFALPCGRQGARSIFAATAIPAGWRALGTSNLTPDFALEHCGSGVTMGQFLRVAMRAHCLSECELETLATAGQGCELPIRHQILHWSIGYLG